MHLAVIVRGSQEVMATNSREGKRREVLRESRPTGATSWSYGFVRRAPNDWRLSCMRVRMQLARIWKQPVQEWNGDERSDATN